jgi:hypothetical protein
MLCPATLASHLRGWCNRQHNRFWPCHWGFESSPPSSQQCGSAPSSSGLGRRPLKAVTAVRICSGLQSRTRSSADRVLRVTTRVDASRALRGASIHHFARALSYPHCAYACARDARAHAIKVQKLRVAHRASHSQAIEQEQIATRKREQRDGKRDGKRDGRWCAAVEMLDVSVQMRSTASEHAHIRRQA